MKDGLTWCEVTCWRHPPELTKSNIPPSSVGFPRPSPGLGFANRSRGRGDLIPEVRSKNTMSLVPMEEVGDTDIISLRVGRPDVLHSCDLNLREIELRMGSLEFGKSLQ